MIDNIDRQILKNQSTILLALSQISEVHSTTIGSISERMLETKRFFEDELKEKKEDACDMSEEEKA